MKVFKKILTIIVIILGIAVLALIVLLIIKSIPNNKNKSNLTNTTSDSLVYIDEKGSPTFIDNYDYTLKSKDDILGLLKELSELYGFTDKLDKEFKVISEEEANGIKYYKIQQLHDSIPVFGHQLVIGTKDNKVTSITGHYQKDIKIANYKTLTDAEILNILKTKFSGEIEVGKNHNKYIYVKDGETYYTYLEEVKTESDEYSVFVDINNKKIVDFYSNLELARDTYTYKFTNNYSDYSIDITKEGDDYYLESNKHGFIIVDGSNLEMETDEGKKFHTLRAMKDYIIWKNDKTPMKMNMVDGNLFYNKKTDLTYDSLITFNNIQKIYEYYEKLGRKSVDGTGKTVRLFVGAVNDNKLFGPAEPYNNAAWFSDLDIIVIGTSNGTSYGRCLDVMGHEFTHGVVRYTANLSNGGIQGAINESYADIMGSLIENKDFEMGDCVGTIRSISDPNKDANPTIVGGEYYFPNDTNFYNKEWQEKTLKYFEEYGKPLDKWQDYDSNGVHINSTVPSYAAYLAYKNGAYQDRFEMAKVYYGSLLKLTSSATYDDVALAVLRSAADLGFTKEKLEIIRDAFIKTKMLASVPYKVTGKVMGEDGKVLENVEVRALYKNNKAAGFTTYTDKDGNYTFEELPSSEYIIIYDKGKYEEKEVEVTIDCDKTMDDVKLVLKDKETGPSEIVLVMDISHSMEDNDPKDIRKQMISNVVSELDSNAKVSLVTFAKTANVNADGINSKVDNKNITTDIFNITNDDGYNDNSGTNGKAGLAKALSLFTNNKNRKYIVFFTDGEDTISGSDDLSYDEIITKANEKGIRIITIGLGRGLSTATLTKLSNNTNGKHFNASFYNKLNVYTNKLYDEIK